MKRCVRVSIITLLAGCAQTDRAPSEASTDEGPVVESETTTEVETLSPRERDQRGDERLFVGRFAEAADDFDAYVEAFPESDPYHWRRGIAYYYAERYEEGAAQFVRHRTVNPNDVENAAWHFLCVARYEGLASARAALLPVGPDQRDPMREVYELYAGRATVEDVLSRASSSPQYDAEFFAHLYLALYFDVLGDLERARYHIRLATTEHARGHYMGRVAQAHADVLEAQRPNARTK